MDLALLPPSMSGNFEKDSFGWQFQLFQQRIGEWWENLFAPLVPQNPGLPNVSVPEWFWRVSFWVIAIALALWILWQLYVLLSPYFGWDWFARRGKPNAPARPPERVLAGSEWLDRARQYAQRGNYREACRALYLAMIQTLDETGKLPNQPSRTNGEYLNVVQTFANPRPYQDLIQTHDRLCFGNADISRDTFERCDRAYRETETA